MEVRKTGHTLGSRSVGWFTKPACRVNVHDVCGCAGLALEDIPYGARGPVSRYSDGAMGHIMGGWGSCAGWRGGAHPTISSVPLSTHPCIIVLLVVKAPCLRTAVVYSRDKM